jgi:four helix bundle protein
MQFAHEKLMVYDKILAFIGFAEDWLGSWDRKHAFVDHLSRASESTLANLVEAVRIRKKPRKQRSMDYSVGSTMECGACLDIACIKGLLNAEEGVYHKGRLVEIVKMLIGLRKSWEASHVHEDPTAYANEPGKQSVEAVFHHESLSSYQFALRFYRWFLTQDTAQSLAGPFERRIDKFATRILLNVAEGNGRFSVLDQRNFLDIANSAAAKAAAYLDIGIQKGIWSKEDISEPKTMLVRIGRITARKDYDE